MLCLCSSKVNMWANKESTIACLDKPQHSRICQCTFQQFSTCNLSGKLSFSRPQFCGPQQIAQILKICAHTRKSLVKGKRFIRMCGHLECSVCASLGSGEDNVQHETFARHKFLRCLMGPKECRQLS